MSSAKKICVLGNYSGRNAGDTAILAGALREISSRYPTVEYLVPTLNPRFIEHHFGEYGVTPVNILPWKGSLKLLGLPAWNAIRTSDLVLVTDALLFDRGLYNPMHNYLSTLALWIPGAKKRDIPVVLYNVSVGPVTTRAGLWCLRRVLQNADLIVLRDDESKITVGTAQDIQAPIRDGADSALSAVSCDTARVQAILRENGVAEGTKPRIGININAYGDAFVKDGKSDFSEENMLRTLSQIIRWIYQDLGADVWLFGTQHMDISIMKKLQNQIDVAQRVPLFTNRRYSYAELMGLFGELDLLIGMRTHSLILASSAGVPVIGLIAYPKTLGYLRRIGQAARAIPITELALEPLKVLVHSTWKERAAVRRELCQAVEVQRGLAWQAAEFLAPYLRNSGAAQV
ncbi:MAG: polysaccharide pyruvyl transferase family protein [Planctomycetota bacterium]|jgi:polysaccharide pyruvyl transferase WcaK-like protein